MIAPATYVAIASLLALPLELSAPTDGRGPALELINENDNWGINLGYTKGADDFGRTFGGLLSWQSARDSADGQWWLRAQSLHSNCSRVVEHQQRLETSSLCRRVLTGWNPSTTTITTETLRSDMLTLSAGRSGGDEDRRIWWGVGWGWVGQSPITPLPEDIQAVVHRAFGFPVYVESAYAPEDDGPTFRGGVFRRWRLRANDPIWLEQSTEVFVSPFMAALGNRMWAGQRIRVARGHLEVRGGGDLLVQDSVPQLSLAFRRAIIFTPSAEARLIAPSGFAVAYRVRFLLDGQESVGSYVASIPL